MIERLGDQALSLIRGVLRCHDRAGADDRLCHFAEKFELAVAEGVMHQGAALLDRAARHAYQVKHRQVLGARAGDRAECAELADPVRRADRTGTADAGISVGGIACIELVAAADPVDSRIVHDRVVHRESEIAGHAEDILNSNRVEPSQDMPDDCLKHSGPLLH